MKPRPKSLHLVDHDEPTRQQIAMAQIEQNMREWSKDGWHPFDEPRKRPALVADDVLSRSQYRIEVSRRVPIHRRLLRWVGRIFS